MKLKSLEVNSFAGINPNSPVIIDFTDTKWITASGDMGVGKTSLLNALLVACGNLSHTGKEGKNFINNETNKIDINFDFVGNDRCNYNVRCTKSSFTLTYDGEVVSEPITKMKELLGVAGVSPMEIKNKPLKDIVRWLAGYSTKSAEEFEADLTKFKNGIKIARESRAAANKSLKALNEYLDGEYMFKDWEGSEKKYVFVDTAKISKEFTEISGQRDTLLQAETKLTNLKSNKKSIEEQMEQLQLQLDAANSAILKGEQFIKDNDKVKTKYDEVKLKYDNAALDATNYNKWQEIKKKKGERDEFETLSQQADAKEKEILQQQKDLQAELLPDIKGVELVTEDTTEDGVTKKEGLYWNGVNAAQMSETEFWNVVLLIWRKYKVRVIVIDNYQSLGSGAVDILEKLVKDGCYILAAEMDRKTKTLEIEYK